MKIKYEKIITNNFKFEINETELAKLKEEAKIERARIKYYQRGNDFTLQNRAEERVYLANDYKTKNDIEKAILLANIVFEKEERFAEMLLNGNFDKRILESFIKLLDYLKSKKANNDLNETDLQYEKKCEALATKLVKQISRYIGPVHHEVIINKINEILSFCPELLENHTKVNIRKK